MIYNERKGINSQKGTQVSQDLVTCEASPEVFVVRAEHHLGLALNESNFETQEELICNRGHELEPI